MTSAAIARWSWIHKWSSLICTVFLLLLCITGLPLIFHDEIDDALNPGVWKPANPSGKHLDLDTILRLALENRPGEVPIFMSFDIDRPVVNVTTGPSADALEEDMYFASFDLTSGNLVPPADVGESVMEFIFRLHVDLFMELPGMLFLGFMGFLFIIATISGVVLYAPFMKKIDFGKIRLQKSSQIKWLDYHNFLGIITLAWVLVVGITGVINTLEQPIIDRWRQDDLRTLIAEHGNTEPLTDARASLHDAVKQATVIESEMKLQFVAFPGSSYSTQSQYSVFLHGDTPLTKHLIMPVLIHAGTGEVTGVAQPPIIVKALSLSRPLHFGDYGGFLLKLIWAILDLMTIVVLITGIYLWLKKRQRSPEKNTKLVSTA